MFILVIVSYWEILLFYMYIHTCIINVVIHEPVLEVGSAHETNTHAPVVFYGFLYESQN